MEIGTQTEQLLTIPLEVLTLSCITYNMIDQIRGCLQQAERDLCTLLFGSSIPDSVLGRTPTTTTTTEKYNDIQSKETQDLSRDITRDISRDITRDISCDISTKASSDILHSTFNGNVNEKGTRPVFEKTENTEINGEMIPRNNNTPSPRLRRKLDQRSRDVVTSRDGMTSRDNDKLGRKRLRQDEKQKQTSVKVKEEVLETEDKIGRGGTAMEVNHKYQCGQCRVEFSSEDRLARHVTLVHSSAVRTGDSTVSQPTVPNINQCVICCLTFTNGTALREHQLKQHNHTISLLGAGLICNICGKCSTDKQSFEEHKIKHTINKSYRCHVCYKGFSQSDNLMQHLRVIHNKR